MQDYKITVRKLVGKILKVIFMASKKKNKQSKNQNIEIGKEIKAETKPVNAKIEEKQISNEGVELRKKFAEVDEAMRKFNMYPVAINEQAKNEALATIKKIYSESNLNVKQAILYVLHESLSRFSEYRMPKNLEYFKKKFPQNEPLQLRMSVYQGMFNYSNSIEGLIELVHLLSDLGDDDSAKVLTHHFSFLCSFDGSEGSRMLRNAIVDALGKTKSPYALKALLTYAKNVDNEQLGGRMISAIIEWRDKIQELKISQKEKDEMLEKINELVQVEREGGYYR